MASTYRYMQQTLCMFCLLAVSCSVFSDVDTVGFRIDQSISEQGVAVSIIPDEDARIGDYVLVSDVISDTQYVSGTVTVIDRDNDGFLDPIRFFVLPQTKHDIYISIMPADKNGSGAICSKIDIQSLHFEGVPNGWIVPSGELKFIPIPVCADVDRSEVAASLDGKAVSKSIIKLPSSVKKKIVEKVTKVLGKKVGKVLESAINDCEIPEGLWVSVLAAVPIIGDWLVPCIVQSN